MFSVTESDVRRRVAPLVAVLLAAVLLAAVLATVPTASDAQEGAERAVAALVDDGGEDAGEVGFADVGDGRTFVYAELDLERVSDGGFHGFHVHENASCEDGFAAAGGHYDLGGADHGAHAGDMPVLLADGETGDAVAGFVIERFTVDELLDEGTAVIVHERADNYANVPDRYESDGETGPDGDTLATGDAGARVACGVVEEGEGPSPDAQRTGRIAQAEVAGPDGEVSGTATFGELDDGRVLVSADVEGLPGGGVHGFHVHGTGSCEDGFAAAGGHFNTGGADHGAHAGDMPVLLADEDGTAEAQFVTDRVTVDDLLESDDGTAVIVHAAPDNYANIPDRYEADGEAGPDADTLATGDAGGRLACGVAESFVDVQRFGGADRIETAVAVSQGLYPVPDSAGAVVLARAGDFADALAGTPLAHARNAPTLLTGGDELDPRTAAEIDRLLAGRGTVHVLGGEAAIGPGVVDALTDGGYDVERVAGADRFETSVAVAEALGNPDSVLLARGGDFPDAVTAGAAAAHTDGAVLLTTGDEPHPAAAAYLDEHEPAETFAVGGPAVRAHPDAAAVSGPHRWGTAREVAETFFSEPSFAGIARGDAFPDALTGGVLSGGSGGPVLLTLPAALPDDTAAYLCANASSLSFAGGFGGPAAISDEVLGEVRARIDGQGC